ncbi:hypothetical protein [Roseinatronobacter sp. NSM]|uniref:hypothetical protein n=1 Tax=Roseinatronobacter sp. NSM TaxID=3457785 RepID=UPI004034FF15
MMYRIAPLLTVLLTCRLALGVFLQPVRAVAPPPHLSRFLADIAPATLAPDATGFGKMRDDLATRPAMKGVPVFRLMTAHCQTVKVPRVHANAREMP